MPYPLYSLSLSLSGPSIHKLKKKKIPFVKSPGNQLQKISSSQILLQLGHVVIQENDLSSDEEIQKSIFKHWNGLEKNFKHKYLSKIVGLEL